MHAVLCLYSMPQKKLTFHLRRMIVEQNDLLCIFIRLNDKWPFCFKIRMRIYGSISFDGHVETWHVVIFIHVYYYVHKHVLKWRCFLLPNFSDVKSKLIASSLSYSFSFYSFLTYCLVMVFNDSRILTPVV